jgi:hypothetical protein
VRLKSYPVSSPYAADHSCDAREDKGEWLKNQLVVEIMVTRKNEYEGFQMRGRNRRGRIMIVVIHNQMICTNGLWRIRKNTMNEVGKHRLLPSMALQHADAVMKCRDERVS